MQEKKKNKEFQSEKKVEFSGSNNKNMSTTKYSDRNSCSLAVFFRVRVLESGTVAF